MVEDVRREDCLGEKGGGGRLYSESGCVPSLFTWHWVHLCSELHTEYRECCELAVMRITHAVVNMLNLTYDEKCLMCTQYHTNTNILIM